MNYADFWKRFAAFCIDFSVLTVGYFVLYKAVDIRVVGGTYDLTEAEDLLSFLGIILPLAYYVLLESSSMQGTLGKMALGMKVTDLEGNRIGFCRAAGRYIGKFLSALIFGMGYLMIASTPKKQALHDIMAGCLVMNRKTTNPECC